MSLRTVRAENVRCLEKVRLEPTETNLIIGENASGKTSLLEAIFILGRGRSFRTVNRGVLIRDGQKEMTVSGVVHHEGRNVRVGISQHVDEPPRIRVDGRDENTAAALARCLPVQVIDPNVHELVEEGPGVRRKFLDWGVFHVEPLFLDTWRRYHRVVRQRNAALRAGSLRQLDAWDQEVVSAGELLGNYRRHYAAALGGYLKDIGHVLLGTAPQLIYRQGWRDDQQLCDALGESRERDRKFGVTHVGPHRADISIQFAARKARGRVSRGQQKLLAAALVLAQLSHLREARELRSILLLDDLAAELDRNRVARLREVVCSLDAQLFLTALQRADLAEWKCSAVFHVEQGKVHSVL